MDIHKRPISGINDPTPNSPSLSSSPSSSLSASRTSHLLSPQASSSSTITSQSLSIPAPSNQLVTSPSRLNLDQIDWANLFAAATVAQKILPSNPLDISQRLTEINKKEEKIAVRRKNLEAQLAEIRSEENDLSIYRSQLITQLEKVLSPQSSLTANPLTTSAALSPTIKPRETTIIEELDPETAQPRSSDSNASMTSITKKKPGPASKTGLSGVKVINPGSLPPLGPISSSSKKSQNGDGSSKKPVTTGVKQSRPQPMRARKRTKPVESGSSTAPASQVNPDLVQTNNESQPKPQAPTQPPVQPQPKPQTSTQPQPPVQTQPQQSKPSSIPQKSQVPIVKNPVFKEKIKTEPEEKPRIPSATLKNDDTLKPSPFKERAESSNTESETLKRKIKQEPITKPKKPDNIVMATDEDSEAVRCNPVQDGGADDDDEAHSDSEIFNVLKSVEQSNEETPEIGAKKIKKDPDQPSNLVNPKVEPQEATRREPYIKQEK